MNASSLPASPWGRIKSLYGMAEPYDFERAFPFVAAVFLAVLVILTAIIAWSSGNLNWGTFRAVYLIYLACLAFAAAALSFAPRWSWTLIAVGFMELLLGLGSQLLAEVSIVRVPLLPANERLGAPQQFQFHPLLQETPSPNYVRVAPFRIAHDSQGLRGAERDPRQLRHQIVVAAIGGSSTYDIALPNGEIWTDVLERKLGSGYAVLNHGVPGYSTTEHIIQTGFYLDSYNIRPRCALYYIGWNDIRNAYLPHLDPAYADYHLLSQAQDLRAHYMPFVARISPLARIIIPWLARSVAAGELPENFEDKPAGHGRDIRLEKIYRAHIETIASINASRGITTLFVGQVLNRAKLWRTTRTGHWFPLIRDVDTWPLQTHYNDILEDTANALHVPVLIPSVDKFDDSDFADRGHFASRGAEKFAALLAPFVKAHCEAAPEKSAAPTRRME